MSLEHEPGAIITLDDILDVVITTPADNELLAYDGASGNWTNQTPAEAGLDDIYLKLAGGTMAGDIAMGDNSITGIDTLTFTDVNGTIAGIENQNLLDKTATETISGAYTHTNTLTVGTDGAGHDVTFYGDIAGRCFQWGEELNVLRLKTVENTSTHPYSFNIESTTSTYSYMGIFNDGGVDYGAFFGVEDTGGANGVGDNFSLYNWQQGDVILLTSTVAGASTNIKGAHFTNEGYFSIGINTVSAGDPTQYLPTGWNDADGSVAYLVRPSNGQDGGFFSRSQKDNEGFSIWHDTSPSPDVYYFDLHTNNNAGNLYFRTKIASGSPVTAMTILGSGDIGFTNAIYATPDEITATSEGVAASIATVNTEVTTNGDSDLDNVTLANGTSGQIKHIYCVAEGNAADTWKITPATMCGGTQITFAGVGEGCTLVYANNEGWVVVANNGGTIT